MSLKYSLFLSICLYLYLLIYRIYWPIAILVIMIFVLFRIRNWKAIFFVFVLLYFVFFPRFDCEPDFYEGKVVEIKEKYILVKHQHQKVLLYTNADVSYDDTISFTGDYQQIEESYHFYHFNFKKYMEQKNIYYSISPYSLTVIKKTNSFRGRLFNHISKLDEEKQIYLKKIIFNISTSDFNELDILMDSGISLTGILYFLKFILEKIVKEKRLNRILILINFLLCMFYHFPFSLTQYLIFNLMKQFDLAYNTRIGLSYFVILFLFPTYITSISFMIPMIYRLIHDQKELRFLLLSIIQSISFHEISILKVLFFRILVITSGFISFSGWLTILIPFFPIQQVTKIYEFLLSIFNLMTIKGSPIGIIFILFVICFLPLMKEKKWIKFITISYYLFLYFGLFHPFGEFTYINVGQGNAILIRYPFNRQNILIDTGKASQYEAVKDYLESKSIKTIHHLVITHYDEDHSGNIDALKKDFHVKELNDTKEDVIYNDLCLYQINPISSDDENESSLVFITKINGLNYLIMGDATKDSEKEILKCYPNLKADILQAGHHGSKTSSSKKFIEEIQPSIAVFSCGNYSYYHHPSEEVVSLFQSLKIDMLSTHEVGDISFIFLPVGNLLLTANHKIIYLK